MNENGENLKRKTKTTSSFSARSEKKFSHAFDFNAERISMHAGACAQYATRSQNAAYFRSSFVFFFFSVPRSL